MGTFGRTMALLLGGTALVSWTGMAAAQGRTDVELAPVVVQGQQKKKPASPATDTPLATQTSGEDIRKNEISDISDLGNTTEPGVDYSRRTDGPVIRGLDGPRVLTVVDGIPIPYLENYARGSASTPSNPTNADGGGLSFDFSSISALDVLRGADSSRIGSGVLGGAIVLRTLEPEDILEEGRNWGGLAKTTYDSEDDSIAGALAVAGRDGPISVLLQGAYKTGHERDNQGTDDSYGALRTEPDPLDFDQNNVLFKVRHTGDSGHRIGLTAERFHRDATADLATQWNRPVVFPSFYFYAPGEFVGNDSNTRERVSLDYDYLAPEAGGLIETAFAKAYWQNLTKHAGSEGIRSPARTPYLRDNELETETLGIVGGASGHYDTGSLNHDWKLGFDFASFQARHFIEVVPTTPVNGSQSDMPDIDGTTFGAYIDNRISFEGSRFALTPGLRFDWHDYRPQESDTYSNNPGSGFFPLPPARSGTRVTPKLLATYEVSPQLEIFAQWSGAYRAPTVNELYLNFTNPATGYAQVGNPDLKPETGHGIEAGVNFGDESFGGRVTAFHNEYKNFIVATGFEPYPGLPVGLATFENIDEVTISGVELQVHKLFDNGIRLHGGLSYAHGEDGDGNMVPTVAPYKAIAGIGYERENWGADLTGIFVGSYRNDTLANPIDADSYAIANLSTWWEPTAMKGMRIQAGVKNLFDETYYDAMAIRNINLTTSGQPEEFYSAPGRTFTFSLTQKF